MTEQKSQLVVVEDSLSLLLEKQITACPKGFNKTRFLQNCMTVLNELRGLDPAKLAKITPGSIVSTMAKGAFLGLDFFNRECYAIPFGSQLQFLTDYKGDMKLCKRYAVKPVKDIYAKLVRKEDIFKIEIIKGSPAIDFSPVPFSNAEVIGAFAVVVYEDGTQAYETMSKDEIEATRRNFSKCQNSPAWLKASGEMYKKTVLKRLCKVIELNFDNAEQDKAFEAGGDLDTKKVIDVVPEEVVDAFPKEKEQPGITGSGEPKPKKPQPEKAQNTSQSDQDFIIQIQREIEKFLDAQGKESSLVYKYSMDLYHKRLEKLTLAEIKELKNKVLNNQI